MGFPIQGPVGAVGTTLSAPTSAGWAVVDVLPPHWTTIVKAGSSSSLLGTMEVLLAG